MKLAAIKQINGERIIVKLIDNLNEQTTESGLIIAKTNMKTKHHAVLVEVVDSAIDEFKIGQRLLCSQRAGEYITDDVLVLNTGDILCRVK